MKKTEFKPKVKDLLPGYCDDENTGCYAMNGDLCVRPDYQRAFVYDDKKRNLVVDTVQQGMPLGIMYWMKNANTGKYELMDGQQRTLSLLQYCSGGYSINYQYFHNLSQTEKDKILDYELLVYICEGTDDERREWFQRINVAGATLTNQEILNSVYSGPWCQDAKKYFSNPNGPAHQIAEKHLSGSPIRQDYLETALKWLCNRDGIEIADYMAAHQHDATALELWSYFRSVIDWVDSTFPNYRKKLMKGIPWGILFNQYGKNSYDPAALEARIAELEIDEDVTNQRGIYEYVLGGSERCLSIRVFSERDKRRKYGEQGGKCVRCGKTVEYEKCHGDHITPWSKGGHTTYDNLQILCADCNRTKSAQ